MDNYRVVDMNADGTLVGLRDQAGANHIASLSVRSLQLDDQIDGSPARPGVQMFMSRDCTRLHRLNMLHINCAQLLMLRSMHGAALAESAGD
jgi:hypothetical protein